MTRASDRSRLSLALWLVAAVAVTLTACAGGGDDDGAATAQDIGTPAASTSGDTGDSGDESEGGAAAAGGVEPVASAEPDAGTFTAQPVQLLLDPCALVTTADAERVIGQPVSTGGPDVYNKPICTHTATGDGGVLSVELDPPEFCELLFLALDQDLFGGDQVRIDDIGQGGMLVKGNGNVQFVVDGGCITIASGAGTEPIDDATMLGLAKTAAERAS